VRYSTSDWTSRSRLLPQLPLGYEPFREIVRRRGRERKRDRVSRSSLMIARAIKATIRRERRQEER